LGKLENKSRGAEKRQFQMDPQVRKIKNKAGVVEMRTVCCAECGEDFCNGMFPITQLFTCTLYRDMYEGKVCGKLGYDSFARQPEVAATNQKVLSPVSPEKTKRKVKRKSRSKSKTKKKSASKSKSPKKRSPSKHQKGRKTD